ncbi:hypothetical protein J7K41_00620 [Candidatus Micrarchaeota archaeon]|nr:hypothetical protein [Candidatus Micrarchaeota archaeon]
MKKIKKALAIGLVGLSLLSPSCKSPSPKSDLKDKAIAETVYSGTESSLQRVNKKKFHKTLRAHRKIESNSQRLRKQRALQALEDFLYTSVSTITLSLERIPPIDSLDIDLDRGNAYDMIMLSSYNYKEAFELACRAYIDSDSEKDRFDIFRAIIKLVEDELYRSEHLEPVELPESLDVYYKQYHVNPNPKTDLEDECRIFVASSFVDGIYNVLWDLFSPKEKRFFALTYLKVIEYECKIVQEDDGYSPNVKSSTLEDYCKLACERYLVFSDYLTEEDTSAISFVEDVMKWIYQNKGNKKNSDR